MFSRSWRQPAQPGGRRPKLGGERELVATRRSRSSSHARARRSTPGAARRATVDLSKGGSWTRSRLRNRHSRPLQHARRRALQHTLLDPGQPLPGARSRPRSCSRRSPPPKLADQYPAVLIVDRSSVHSSRCSSASSSTKTYSIAVGAGRPETPAGLYHIQNKAGPRLERARLRLGGRPRRHRRPGGATRTTRSRRAGWGSSTAPASTARRRRLDRLRRLARLRPDALPDVERALRQGAGRSADLHRLASRPSAPGSRSTGTSSPSPAASREAWCSEWRMSQRADVHALDLLAHHRVPHACDASPDRRWTRVPRPRRRARRTGRRRRRSAGRWVAT